MQRAMRKPDRPLRLIGLDPVHERHWVGCVSVGKAAQPEHASGMDVARQHAVRTNLKPQAESRLRSWPSQWAEASGRIGPWACSVTCFAKPIDDAVWGAVDTRVVHLRTQFLDSALGTEVQTSNAKYHRPNVLERMIKHEGFEIGVVRAAPKLPSQECITNRDFIPILGIQVVAGRANDLTSGQLANDEGAPTSYAAVEKVAKHGLGVAVPGRVLNPNLRVRRHGKQYVKVCALERAKRDKLAREKRLERKHHR